MATKIQIRGNRIIFDGHADNLQECKLITALCDSLAESENFRTVKYESGYAEFEKATKSERAMFTGAPSTDWTFVFFLDGAEIEQIVKYMSNELGDFTLEQTDNTVIITNCSTESEEFTYTYDVDIEDGATIEYVSGSTMHIYATQQATEEGGTMAYKFTKLSTQSGGSAEVVTGTIQKTGACKCIYLNENGTPTIIPVEDSDSTHTITTLKGSLIVFLGYTYAYEEQTGAVFVSGNESDDPNGDCVYQITDNNFEIYIQV